MPGDQTRSFKVFRLVVKERTILSFFPLSSVLCELIDVIWKYGTPFLMMIGRTASSDGLLAHIFRGVS